MRRIAAGLPLIQGKAQQLASELLPTSCC